MKFGNLLKKEIKRQGKTQKEIAKIVGISINDICGDKVYPQKKTIDKICKSLGIEIHFKIINKDDDFQWIEI